MQQAGKISAKANEHVLSDETELKKAAEEQAKAEDDVLGMPDGDTEISKRLKEITKDAKAKADMRMGNA